MVSRKTRPAVVTLRAIRETSLSPPEFQPEVISLIQQKASFGYHHFLQIYNYISGCVLKDPSNKKPPRKVKSSLDFYVNAEQNLESREKASSAVPTRFRM